MSTLRTYSGTTSLDQVLEQMDRNLAELERRQDHRAVFQRVYWEMTREMQRRLAGTFFHDPAWMEQVLIGFAEYYFRAMAAYDAGAPCPPAWRVALEVPGQRRAFVLQDALLGINAHINHDLAFVLAEILQAEGAWPDARAMLRRRRDHDRIVWHNTELLLDARDEEERAAVQRRIEEETLVLARTVMQGTPVRLLQPLAPLGRRLRLF